MEIRQLDPAVYAGRKFTARYRTKGYYDICAAEDGFRFRYVPLDAPMEKSFDDEFFGEWLEEPVAFGAFEGERLLGYVEGAPRRAGTSAIASATSAFLRRTHAARDSARS